VAPPSARVAASPIFHVAPEAAARWNIRASGATTVIALEEGRATFNVAHLESDQRFSVALPDGEVEVRGTEFLVDVAMNRTKSVSVSSGTVALRLAGQNEVKLLAGDRWPSTVPDETSVQDGGAPELTQVASRPSHGTPPRPIVVGPAERFDEAMSRFSAGQFGDADARFGAFIHDYPADSRCEDAAFLRAVARSQLGDTEGAAALAAKYLRTYPHGLRRAEAQRLIDADAR
jgi:TolA-binding protein